MGKLDLAFATRGFSTALDWGVYIFIFILVIGIIGIIAYVYFKFTQYNFRVRILDVVGGSFQEHTDRGGIRKTKGTSKGEGFKLSKDKKAFLPPPPAESIIFSKTGKKICYLAKISPTDYVWIKPNKIFKDKDALVEFSPIPQDQLFWMATKIEEDEKKFAKKEAWYTNPYVMSFLTLGLCLVILIITFKYSSGWQEVAKTNSMELIAATKNALGQQVT